MQKARCLREGEWHTMKKGRFVALVLCFQLLDVALAWGQGSYKINSAPLSGASDLPKPLQSVLQPQGERLMDGKGAPVSEVWFSKSVAAQSSESSSGDVLYGGLKMGEFVGVLHFPNAGSDFRGQPIK